MQFVVHSHIQKQPSHKHNHRNWPGYPRKNISPHSHWLVQCTETILYCSYLSMCECILTFSMSKYLFFILATVAKANWQIFSSIVLKANFTKRFDATKVAEESVNFKNQKDSMAEFHVLSFWHVKFSKFLYVTHISNWVYYVHSHLPPGRDKDSLLASMKQRYLSLSVT